MNKIFAYLSDWKYNETDPKLFDGIDTVHYAFGIVNDGKLSINHLAHFDELLNSERKFKVVLSIGGWKTDGFSDAVADEAARKKFIDSIMDVTEEKKLDGIDIDWEWPGVKGSVIKSLDEDPVNFITFMRELKSRIKAYRKDATLSFAAGASPKCINALNVEALDGCIDYLNLMTYDMGGENGLYSHHSNLYDNSSCRNSADRAVSVFCDRGIAPEKIFMGAAFYGKTFKLPPDNGSELCRYAYKDLVNLEGYTYVFDEIAKAPVMYNENEHITYDNPKSLKAKCDYIKSNGLCGIMFWELSMDNGELMKTLNECLK